MPAIVQAWLPGERGGEGVASVLFGEHNPAGHLPVSIPRTVGQLPVHYSRKPNTANEDYVYTESEPLFPFGHGLSYTDFEYRDLALSTTEVPPAGTVTAAVTVEKVGDFDGTDVVQLYASAENPDQARPVQELVGFERVSLAPGETARVAFEVDASQLAYHDRDFDLAVEEGPLRVPRRPLRRENLRDGGLRGDGHERSAGDRADVLHRDVRRRRRIGVWTADRFGPHRCFPPSTRLRRRPSR